MSKKTLALFLLFMLPFTGTSFAMASIGDTATEPIMGRIVQIHDDGSLLIESPDGSQTHVTVDEDTAQTAAWTVGIADFVVITYDGRMTRSLPPQILAQAIHCFSIEGKVGEIDARANRILIESPEIGKIWATLPGGTDAIDYADSDVRIYFGGAVAMSFPAQTAALAIDVVQSEDGRAVEIGADDLIIENDGGQIRVHFDAHTKKPADIVAGEKLKVYYSGAATFSLPPQLYAAAIVREIDD